MKDWTAVENGAGFGRVTCGWKLPHLNLADVRPYWRDVHSPAISRRAGLYEYRHYPLDPVIPDLFGPLAGIETQPPADRQLMWLSDVRYRDQAGLDAFAADPEPQVKARMLADIDMIVDQSTTYLVIGRNGLTLVDRTGDPAPQGPAAAPTYQVFFRQNGDQAGFRAHLSALAARWAERPGVRRVRLNLFEVPDMEAERKAGYPIKTHPLELQYQGWIDLVLETPEVAHTLFGPGDADPGRLRAVHAYPAPDVYTFVHDSRPTFSGLRGYGALKAIRALGAAHQQDLGLLSWMYGPVVGQGPST